MLQLVKLELKKYKLKRYIIEAIICIFCIMAFVTMSFITTLSDPLQQMDTYESTLWMINVLVTGTFLVFSSVLTAKIIIGEYKNKTILVMFSYPINRKKIIIAKLTIIFIFTITSILIGDLLCTAYVIGLDSIIDVVKGNFSFAYFSTSILFGSVVMGGILSLVPFAFGMIKKSGPATIVTAILIVVLMQPIIGKNPNLNSTILKLSIIAILSLITVIYTLRKQVDALENIDIN